MTTDPNNLRTSENIPLNLITPDEMNTRIGQLTFTDGAPSGDTIQKVQDSLDSMRALQVYMDAHQGASIAAFIRGFREIGADDNDFVIFSELMDSQTLFLTPNADTIYYTGIINLEDGPVVFETPPDALGVIDDTWFGHVIDFGRPGPDRGEGGRFLLVPPGYDGSLPDSGFHIAVILVQRRFTIHHARAGLLAELFDHGCRDRRHPFLYLLVFAEPHWLSGMVTRFPSTPPRRSRLEQPQSRPLPRSPARLPALQPRRDQRPSNPDHARYRRWLHGRSDRNTA